jgi:hypothetical protein
VAQVGNLSTSWLIVWPKVTNKLLLLPQANGCTCVDLGAPIQLMGCFEVYPSICWVTNLIMLLYHFILLGCHFPFCVTRFHVPMK